MRVNSRTLPNGALAQALFSSVQRRVLALLFGRPELSFQSAEVIRLVRGGTGGALRELRRLEGAGWVTVVRIGNQKHYQANRACPAFRDLHGLVLKTLGHALEPSPSGRPAPKAAFAPRNSSGARPGPRPAPEERPAAAPGPAPVQNDGWKAW